MGAMQQSLIMSGSGGTPAPIAPYYVLNTATSRSGNTISFSLQKPSSYAEDDIIVLLVESANQTISTPTGGGTWTQVTNSPQSTGTAGAAGGVRLAVFYQVMTAPLNTATVTIADSGDHQVASMLTFRAADPTAPIDVTAGSVKSSATGSTFTLPSVTTTTDKALVLLCVGQDNDAASSTTLSSWTNANLVGLTEREDYTVVSGVGGGVGLADGVKETAGSTGTSTVTSTVATTAAFITVALKSDPNYFDTTKATGAQGSSNTTTYESGEATSSITFNADGTIDVVGGTVVDPVAWVNLPASGVGSSYWVYPEFSGGGTGSFSGTVNSWLQMNTNRTWSSTSVGGSQAYSASITFKIATDSAGTNLVSTSRFTMLTQSISGPAP